jgi:hypothetical protein
MRLFYQKQNIMLSSNSYQNSTIGWGTATSTFIGANTYAPDGSSLAESWYGDGTTWDYMQSDAVYHDNTDSIFIFSAYIKPVSYHSSKNLLTFSIQPEGELVSANVFFTDTKELDYITYDNTGFIINSGYYDAGNGWYRVFVAADPRGLTFDYDYFTYTIYPNAPNGYDATIALWGIQVEETKYRDYVNVLTQTDGTSYNNGDFDFVEFTQLPSELSETYHDTYENKNLIDGGIKRVNTSVDTNLKYMKWSRINYKEHGDMLYKLRESLRDKVNDDCILEYDDSFNNTHKYAVVRVVDFEIEYLTSIKDYAEVTLSYYVLDTISY